jgi:hypothetical protein
MLAALALVTTAFAATAMAEPAAGKWGVGYFRPEAPLGARFWFSPKVGADLGLGYLSSSQSGSPSTSKWTLDLGVPINMGNSGNAYFQIRPGFDYTSDDNGVNTPTTMGLSASLAVEYFFTDNFSLQVADGIRWSSTDPDLPGVNNISGFGTEGFGISNIGFHYYFGKKS